VDWDQVGDWLQRSWHACAPKRLTKLMDVADEF
jgi:phosphoribosylglycinamide formyltransferase 1